MAMRRLSAEAEPSAAKTYRSWVFAGAGFVLVMAMCWSRMSAGQLIGVGFALLLVMEGAFSYGETHGIELARGDVREADDATEHPTPAE